MGEELPTEGPMSMGALYSPVWALSQKGVGEGFLLLHPLYIYLYISVAFQNTGGSPSILFVSGTFDILVLGNRRGQRRIKKDRDRARESEHWLRYSIFKVEDMRFTKLFNT